MDCRTSCEYKFDLVVVHSASSPVTLPDILTSGARRKGDTDEVVPAGKCGSLPAEMPRSLLLNQVRHWGRQCDDDTAFVHGLTRFFNPVREYSAFFASPSGPDVLCVLLSLSHQDSHRSITPSHTPFWTNSRRHCCPKGWSCSGRWELGVTEGDLCVRQL